MTAEPTQQENASQTLARVLEQLVTLEVEKIEIVERGSAGVVAHMTVAGRQHEVVCELNEAGDLLSARVIEL